MFFFCANNYAVEILMQETSMATEKSYKTHHQLANNWRCKYVRPPGELNYDIYLNFAEVFNVHRVII